MKEIWKDIPNYEGRYQVSNIGNVRSLNYNHTKKCKLLTPRIDSDGYKQVALYIGGTTKQKWFRVHRLVASVFIPNPDNLPFVNHKDENPSNNHVDNLEWCNNQYNCTYGTCRERAIITAYNNLMERNQMKNKKSTRYYSGRQERKVAKALNGKLVANSGATAFNKGDVTTDNVLIECKTCISEKKSFSIKKEWLEKNKEEAFEMGKDYSILAFNYGPDTDNYYVIDERLFKQLMEVIDNES